MYEPRHLGGEDGREERERSRSRSRRWRRQRKDLGSTVERCENGFEHNEDACDMDVDMQPTPAAKRAVERSVKARSMPRPPRHQRRRLRPWSLKREKKPHAVPATGTQPAQRSVSRVSTLLLAERPTLTNGPSSADACNAVKQLTAARFRDPDAVRGCVAQDDGDGRR